MITLHLNHGYGHEGVYLRLPATPGEVGEAFALLDSLGEGKVTIFDVDSPVRNLGNYVRNADVENNGTLSTLQSLAHQMCDMSSNDYKVFAGALDSESINGIDDVLRVANNLDRYIMIHGVTNCRELGNFLVDSGYKNFPANTKPYLNYEGIGAEYYAERGGAFTPEGYVLRKQTVQEINEKDSAVFRLTLTNGANQSLLLSLPALEEDLEQAKEHLGIHDFAECSVERIDMIPYLTELIPNECFSVEEANDLACGIEELQQRDAALMTYYSVLSVEQPETFSDAHKLMLEMDNYERVPDNTEEYGKMVLVRHGADDELLEALEGYADFDELGEDAMVEDGVRRTEFGLVRRCSEPWPEETHSMQMGGM